MIKIPINKYYIFLKSQLKPVKPAGYPKKYSTRRMTAKIGFLGVVMLIWQIAGFPLQIL